jgi:creatinine amidohydrolase
VRPWKLEETNYSIAKQTSYEVAVLPLGATEPHNLHLPYGTDTIEGTILGEKICEAAFQKGAQVILLPTVPYGTETNMRQLPLAMNVNPSTLYTLLSDLIESLNENGIHKILLLNSHGGNELKPLLRELHGKTRAQIFLCNWYKAILDVYAEIFDATEDHAGEMETSFMLAYAPHLVARQADGELTADEGKKSKMRFEALNQGWVELTRPWHLLTTNSGAGNPHAATKEKGERLVEVLVERLGTFLVELSAAKIDEQFPF